MLITVAVSTVVWLTVTFLTAPEPDSNARRVLRAGASRRARAGARVSERLGYGRETIPGGALAWTNWLAGIVAVYSTLFGIGKIIFGEIGDGRRHARHRGGRVRLDRRSFREEDAGVRAQRDVVPAAGD